jgi:hypothetical protein
MRLDMRYPFTDFCFVPNVFRPLNDNDSLCVGVQSEQSVGRQSALPLGLIATDDIALNG